MIIQAHNIHKSFEQTEKGVHVLKGIDLDVEEGDVVSIVGPSGAGKSTLLHILGALDAPDQGEVVLDGQNIYKLNNKLRAKIRNEKIGFVFQFYHLIAEFSALENIVLPLLVRENTRSVKKFSQKAKKLLDRVGLAKRIHHRPHQLSGGEQQRVAIARAVINDPNIVFCDEPTGNLDSESGKEIINLLMELNRKDNKTLVIVTHDESIAKMSDHTMHIFDGIIEKKILGMSKK